MTMMMMIIMIMITLVTYIYIYIYIYVGVGGRLLVRMEGHAGACLSTLSNYMIVNMLEYMLFM